MPEERMVFDADGAVRSLRLAVFEKGADFVYPGEPTDRCFNFVDGEPSCIVGTVLHMLGLTHELAYELGVDASTDAWETTAVLNSAEFGWHFNADAREYLALAQRIQDHRQSWGEALAKVEEAFAKDQAIKQ
jgi:hypothetical protein